ncbi:MAG: hypothetical protein AB3N64_08360 [Puniceicoccaceae bacterium]
MDLPFTVQFVHAKHTGSKRTRLERFGIPGWDVSTFRNETAEWAFSLSRDGDAASHRLAARLVAGDEKEVAVGLSIRDDAWTTENFVLIPGAVYAGNRFPATPYDYPPPHVGPDPKGTDRTPRISDLPRLSYEPGKSHLDQESQDAATPALAVYFPARGKALCIFTAQENALGTFGYEVIESDDRSSAEILLMAPGMRHETYFHLNTTRVIESMDTAANFSEGMSVDLDFDLHWFDCGSIQELFDFIFEHRYDCVTSGPLRNEISFSATWDILHEKHNRENWLEGLGIYQVSILNDPPPPQMFFQTGWCGGMITPLPMIQEGDLQSLERSLRNTDLFLSEAASDFGLFHEFYHDGKWFSNKKTADVEKGSYTYDPAKQWTLVRRIGDALYFISRQFLLLRERGLEGRIKPEWRAALRKNAEAVIDVWNRQREFGQYVDVNSGDVMIAGSTAAALIPAALVVAAEFFGESGWVSVAEEIGDKFRLEDLASGVTTGGPGDCAQAPDSESVAALIDSFILLYEATGSAKWLQAAEDAVLQTASWAMSYDYAFPKGTALEEIGAQSRGAFLANAQNKTGVPGICTLSGQSILRVYRATGKAAYLKLLKEIAHTIPQYMGRDDKRIPTRMKWGREGLTELPPGWICERVDVTQWDFPKSIGEIAAYSCWCEVAMMLTWCDIPGVYWNISDDTLYCIDHVTAELVNADQGRGLRISNSTKFDARVKVLAESAQAQKAALPVNVGATLPVVDVKAGASAVWYLSG